MGSAVSARRLARLYQLTCMCALGDGPEAVINASLCVRGVDGLRIIDASSIRTSYRTTSKRRQSRVPKRVWR
ncbi:hypothetical protein HGI47_21570 [Novosphingobium sp. ERN07]|uniref:GMC oxidoreductase n=1 Tax=Novosphingobium sp. ERN07 TaxID=2726187 RepID=UPI001456F5A4|nr:hypothetical protein [Novosphingobium sp. ERN07]